MLVITRALNTIKSHETTIFPWFSYGFCEHVSHISHFDSGEESEVCSSSSHSDMEEVRMLGGCSQSDIPNSHWFVPFSIKGLEITGRPSATATDEDDDEEDDEDDDGILLSSIVLLVDDRW